MRGVAYRLDAMTVGIEYERAIVVGVISGPKPRRTIIPPPGEKRGCMKVPHGSSAGCPEADMDAWRWRPHLAFARDRKFNSKRPRCSAVIGAAASSKIDDGDQSQRLQGRVVEASASFDIAH